MEFESAQSGTTAKLPILKLGEYEMWVIRIKQYFQIQDYAQWEVIENGNSWVSYPDAKSMFAAIETRFGGNAATKKTQKTVLKQQYENFSATKDLNLKFLSSLLPEWNTYVVVWMNKPEVETISIDDLYKNFKIVEQKVKKSIDGSSGAQNLAFMTAPTTNISTASVSDNTVYAFMVENPNGSNVLHQDLEKIHKDDLEAMDLKWQLSLLNVRAKKYYQRTGKKIFINANNIVGECRAQKSNESQFRNQGKHQESKEYNADKFQRKPCDDVAVKLMTLEFKAITYKRGLATLEDQIIIYKKNEVLFSEEIGVLKREVACKDYEINMLKSKFEKVKQERVGIEFKIEKFDKASKDLDQLLGSQITDKCKKGLGYSAVPPPHPFIYNRPNKLDLSYLVLDRIQRALVKGYGPKDSEQESNVVCDNKKSDNSKENSEESLVEEQVSQDTNSFVESFTYGMPQQDDKGFVDSECSRHMTRNIAYLSDFKEFDGGYVAFGGGAYGGRITGKGTLKTDNLDFEDLQFLMTLPGVENDEPKNYDDDQRQVEDGPIMRMLLKTDKFEIEPTSIAKALSDSSWVEAMQEELLQFKLQQDLKDPDYPKQSLKVVKHIMVGIKHKEDMVYVDDIIFGSTNKELCTGFEKLMKDKFQMSSIGELTFFLGLQVQQKDDGIFISQDKYVAGILKKFNYTDVKSASTLVDLEKPLVKDGDVDDVDVHLYRSMIGSLMYLTASRPDIMFVVCACARFQVTPKTSHLLAVKRIFMNTERQPTLGLCFPGFSLELCKKQTVVATSTTEAEYVAAANCYRQVGTPRYLSLVVPLKKVGDEAVHKELGDRMVRAATTASSLEAEQDNGSGPRCQDTILADVNAQTRFEITSRQSNNPPLSRGYTLRTGKDIMKLLELMELYTQLS
ncbi:putative ribonuclease H-like domain-containing protein [Tanacetum coccineum]